MRQKLTVAAAFLLASAFGGRDVHAQISLQTAVDLALKNSPRVLIARADLAKALAAWQETRDAYIPTVGTQPGYGKAAGAPLGLPIVFSVSAQSLVFSFQQRDYVRAAEQSREAAQHALDREQIQVVQDATNTYVALDNGQTRKTVMGRELEVANRLVTVTSERIDAGVDAKVELPKARRTLLQIQLGSLQLDDENAGNVRHLATLTGLPVASIRTESSSLPEFQVVRPSDESAIAADDAGIASLVASARAKQYAAFAERRYMLRPQITFVANYSRVAIGLSSYAQYYPRFGAAGNSENSFSFGLQFAIPLLDMAHRAKARQSEADAQHALADVELQRGIFREGRAKLQNSALELQLRADLAREEQEIAQDQLETLRLQLEANSGSASGPQATPKDALSAELQERQRYYDLLLAKLQLQQTQINVLQQSGGLSTWVQGTPQGQSKALAPATNTPGVPGTPPQGATPAPPVVTTPPLPHP